MIYDGHRIHYLDDLLIKAGGIFMSLVGQFVFTNLLMNYAPLLWQAYCTINYEETYNKLYCQDCSWIRLRDLLAK